MSLKLISRLTSVSDITDQSMSTKDSIKISIIPSFIASTCCLSPSVLAWMGLVFMSDVFVQYQLLIKLLALLLVFIFFAVYVYFDLGIQTITDLQKQRTKILIILLQSLVVFLVIYAILTQYINPAICAALGEQGICNIS